VRSPSPGGHPGHDRTQRPATTDLLGLVTSAERDALDRWTLTLGGGSVCREPGVDAKYLEGRAAALALVRRALGRVAAPSPALPAPGQSGRTAVEEATRRWRVVADAGRGRAWEAYRTGGQEALDELAAHLPVTR